MLVLNVVIGVVSPWQKTWFIGWLTCPAGFTVILNCFVEPVQVLPPLVKDGVTTIVAIIGEELVFVAVNVRIEPLPEDASPIEVWSLLHV